MASQLIVKPLKEPLLGSIPLPGDQEIALPRMALAALSRGRSTLKFSGQQRSMLVFRELLRLFGIESEWKDSALSLKGTGLFGASAPSVAIDLRGEASVAGLALGLFVSRPFQVELIVDEVVSELLVPALRAAHTIVQEPASGGGARLQLGPWVTEERPEGLSVLTHGVYPWVKQALLLAGLRARTPTVVEERLATVDHLERAMLRARIPLDVQGTVATLHPPRDDDALAPQVFDPLGSQALCAPLIAAALMHEHSRITLRDVGTNPTSSDFLNVARLCGARVGLTPGGDRQGEPYGSITVEASPLRGLSVGGETAVRLGDSAVPLLAVVARAQGQSMLTDLVARARGASPKIWGRAAGLLSSAGVAVKTSAEGLLVVGRGSVPFEPLMTTTGGDSRLALLATVLALGAKGQSVVDDVDCLGEDFPRWVGCLRALGAEIEVRQA